MSHQAFGKTNLETAFEGPTYFKLKTPDAKKGETSTELIVRLLPAMKSFRDTGEWKVFYGQHYGYYGTNPRNPEKPRPRPFACIQKKNKAKEIVEHCPKCDQIEEMRKKYKAREDALRAANPGVEDKSPEWYALRDADPKLKPLAEWLRKHNCDKKFWMNVMSKDGKFGVLQLSYETTMNVLMPCLTKLRDEEKIDPFDPSAGVFLKFTRTGQNPRVKDAVAVYQEQVEINGKKYWENATAPLTEEQCERALKLCPDLKKEAVTFISFEKIQALVDCSGAPEEVDAILGEPKKAEAKTEPEEPKQEAKAPAKEAEPKAEPEAEAPSDDDDEEAKAMAALKAAQAKKAAKKAEAAKAAEKPAPKKDSGFGPTIDSPESFIDEFDAAQ